MITHRDSVSGREVVGVPAPDSRPGSALSTSSHSSANSLSLVERVHSPAGTPIDLP